MLKETETEETIGFFVTFLSLVAFQLGESEPPGPPWLCLRESIRWYKAEMETGRVAGRVEILRPAGQSG